MSSISSKTFTVNLPSSSDDSISRASRRIIVHTGILTSAKICSGDVLALSRPDKTNGNESKIFAVGIAWPSQDISQDSIVVSSPLTLTGGFAHGDKIQISPLNGGKLPAGLPSLKKIQEARTVKVQEVNIPGVSGKSAAPLRNADGEKGKRRDWLPLLVREALVHLKYLTPTQTLDVTYEGVSRRFKLVSVSAQLNNDSDSAEELAYDLQKLDISRSSNLWTVGWDTVVTILDTENAADDINSDTKKQDTSLIQRSAGPDAYASVGGLDKQIAQVRDLIEIPLTRPELFRHFGLKPPRGILLHGPPGTGKTHLARAIAASTQSSVLIINGPELSSAYHGETESKLRDVFSEARSKSPCIVVLDEVDALCPRREDGPGGEVEKRVVAQLLTIMDGMGEDSKNGDGDRVVVVATTNRPNAIDPALRRPGRFDREIEIGIPDAEARCSILEVLLRKTPHSLSSDDIRSVAARAHGYVGADLSAVVREAGTTAIKRWLGSQRSGFPSDEQDVNPKLTTQDLLASLTSVRPSALRSVFLDTVPVRYSDIGGQAETIQKLREMIEWPLLHPEAFERLGVRSPKGVLLYGPPGCSKTLLVRACATESGVNFVAVKGPELLNKYVGESERAVREIFRKARAASPSIIFFDEIDALASSRSGSETGGSHEGVLTSLLNEMDGVQELLGVTVVAATNRPDVIDSALMRPGRLDRILYVGPPDQAGREEILRIRLRKMSVEPNIDIPMISSLAEGCSGAEMTALCQEAALLTMKEDINAPYVPQEAFIAAARSMKKQITPDVIAQFETWSGKHVE
ncbi:AAA family ATPase [Cristinia sonorae]|uniref:AAA family ATPase n=1 Tax=Cristinia sonorae TaxID=1940300 RepID=A0A8K0UEQ0_9AGAR|nr:AAA family ATPase [Cristinia sonorae]